MISSYDYLDVLMDLAATAKKFPLLYADKMTNRYKTIAIQISYLNFETEEDDSS